MLVSRLLGLWLAASLLATGARAQDAPDNLTLLPPVRSDYDPPRTPWGDPDLRGTWPLQQIADAIYAIETDDGAQIQIRNKGLRHGPPEVMDRLRRGEDDDPAEYYFRTVPEFIAPVGPYDWLNKSIFICSGARYASSIKLWVWRVL